MIKPWSRIRAGGRASFPEGVFRVELPLEFLLDRGLDAGAAYGSAGINTLTLERGRWIHHLEGPANPEDCTGTYAITEGRIALVVDAGLEQYGCGLAGSEIFSARWTLDGRQLRFVDVDARYDDFFAEAVWGGKPWTKIG